MGAVLRRTGVLGVGPALLVVVMIAIFGAGAVLGAGAVGRAEAATPRVGPVSPPVGGVTLGYLPRGLGEATDFAYDYDDVDFASRVWEARSSESEYGVQLDVTVMRGARLSSGDALRHWFVAYEQRDPEPAYVRTSVHGAPGWRCTDQLFWLVRPGLAVSVQIDTRRFSARAVGRIARAARPPAA